MESKKMTIKHFITPESAHLHQKKTSITSNGALLFVACNSGIDFANTVKTEYEKMLKMSNSSLTSIPIMGTKEKPIISVFSDSETRPRLDEHVADSDVYVFQSVHENISGNTVNENIQQLLQVVRTLRAHRAKTITVITPYSPYSRQDKPTFMKREAALAALFADQLKVAGADIYLTYHAHTMGLCGFYEPEIQFVALSGLALFYSIFKEMKGKSNVLVVSTDAGGAKFAIRLSELLNLSHAISSKFRKEKDRSNLLGIIGDLDEKDTAIITDDETVTGSSLLNTVEGLYKNFNIKNIHIAISHLKLKKQYLDGFIRANKELGLTKLHITDTIPQIPEVLSLDFIQMHSIGNAIASTINRLHYNKSIGKIFTE